MRTRMARAARGEYDRLPAMAAELVSRQVAMLVAAGGDPSARAAKAATTTIPIVFGSGDPIKAGLVASLNRPGGNATGVHILTNDLEPKRLGLVHQLFPGAALFGPLLNPKFPPVAQQARELAEAARTIGRQVVLLNASTDAELDAAFATLVRRRVVAMLVAADPRHAARSNHCFRGTTEAARNLPLSRICGGRRADELRREPLRSLSRGRYLCGEDSQWREAGKPPGDTIGQVRAGDQPEDREDAWFRISTHVQRARRRSDRMKWRRFFYRTNDRFGSDPAVTAATALPR
jgi:ABC transporter substrate binding protein